MDGIQIEKNEKSSIKFNNNIAKGQTGIIIKKDSNSIEVVVIGNKVIK